MSITQTRADTARSLSPMTVDAIEAHAEDIIRRWMAAQRGGLAGRQSLLDPQELLETSREFFAALIAALRHSDSAGIEGSAWTPVREIVECASRTRAEQGLTPSETFITVLALKETLADTLRQLLAGDPSSFLDQLGHLSRVLDALGLHTMEAFVKSREDVIRQQSRDLLEISCPCIRLWEGVLAVPIIGILDSRRSQQIMETLLQMVVDTRSRVVILDITGVPTVDTLTAAHLIKTVQAVRLLGAQALISGISGRIAQTLVGLGLDLTGVETKAVMADGVADAFERLGLIVTARDGITGLGR